MGHFPAISTFSILKKYIREQIGQLMWICKLAYETFFRTKPITNLMHVSKRICFKILKYLLNRTIENKLYTCPFIINIELTERWVFILKYLHLNENRYVILSTVIVTVCTDILRQVTS